MVDTSCDYYVNIKGRECGARYSSSDPGIDKKGIRPCTYDDHESCPAYRQMSQLLKELSR